MATFGRLLGFLRPYRRGVLASFAFATAAMAMTVAIPWLTGKAINQINEGDRADLKTLAAAVFVAGLLRLGLTFVRRIVAGRVSLGVEYDLRGRMYQHLQALELAFFDSEQTGQLMSRATVDLQSVRFFLGYGLIFMIQSLLTIVLASVAMLITDPVLALISLAPVPFVILVAFRYGRRSRPALQEVQQRIAELTADVEENIGGVRVVKAFAAEGRQQARFDYQVGRVFEQAMISTRLQAFYNPLIGFLPQLGLAAVLFFGGRQVIGGSLSIGAFTAFYVYLLMLISPMRTFGVSLGLAQRATASGARLFQILDREPQVTAAPGAGPLPPGRGEVRFESASLRYPGASRDALHEIDLVVPAGRTVAIVGGTGSGKSSLVQLVPRLYDVTGGAVLVDGADVREVDPVSLRDQVAVVDDDPFLFSASIAENIAYGRPDASPQEIREAAAGAQALSFIESLPEGFQTMVGERGMTLSGGQRQRVAIARALVTDPRILILDDATSSVDASTESEIKQALTRVMEGRTTFVIAHRLSTIALAQEIVLLEDGELIAHGNHEKLLEESELYRQIVEKGLPDQVFLTRKPAEREVAGL
ncbi:MAG: ABC transporter ATP-binding protein/permease [Acidobacteria bacterium]|nr:ABC transporter ATP-binding protein/permease [Acidobacteriota bacterium]